jgi:molybdopterin/thiamine biosynthesis adenylyltransferase
VFARRPLHEGRTAAPPQEKRRHVVSTITDAATSEGGSPGPIRSRSIHAVDVLHGEALLFFLGDKNSEVEMSGEFLSRSLPIFTEDGIAVLRSKVVAFAGLGGVGGGAFLALVRCGVTRFRLAENGVFDPPDMNRQAAAFGHTMDRRKLDVYVESARSINPLVELEPFPEGIDVDNIERFLAGADVYVGVIDVEKGHDVKAMTPALLERYDLPLFTCGVVGFGAILIAHRPGGMMPDEFWRLVKEKSVGGSLLPSFLTESFTPSVVERLSDARAAGIIPTTAIGGLAANVLLACEVLVCLLQGTKLVDREPVYAPRFTTVDFLNQTLDIGDAGRRTSADESVFR